MSKYDVMIEAVTANASKYKKLDELFRAIGVEPPESGTRPEACIPIIEAAIEKVELMRQCYDEYG